MSYKVSLENFEGPFDLLLHLVARSRLAIGTLSLSNIVDQYLEEIRELDVLDLDTASDFLMVASSLLEIKAKALLPQEIEDPVVDKEIQDPIKAREELIDKLVTYKQFKNAAEYLGELEDLSISKHKRTAGIPRQFDYIMPDFLRTVSTEDLALLAVSLMGRKDSSLLESDHIADLPLSIEHYTRSIEAHLAKRHHCSFKDLLADCLDRRVVVVTFLALLDLYKRGTVEVLQSSSLGDISITLVKNSEVKLANE